MTDKRTITKDEYLKALALFVCASDHYVKMRQMEALLAQIVGEDDDSYYCGNISDALYKDDPVKVADFDAALKKEKIVVE